MTKRKVPNQKQIEQQDAWMGDVHAPKVEGDTQWNENGTPMTVPLRRFENDRSLRASHGNFCCNCDLFHVYTYEVFRAPSGVFFLTKRSYRVDGVKSGMK
jgi:hypothetical protein